MTTLEQIEQSLSHKIRTWETIIKWQRISAGVVKGLQIGLVFSIVVTLFYYGGFLYLSHLQVIIILLTLISSSIILIIIRILVERQSIGLVAQKFDQTFDLQERTTTALELLSGKLQTSPELKTHQIHDAYQQVQHVNINTRIYPLPTRNDGLRTLALMLMLIIPLALFQPNVDHLSSAPIQPEPDHVIIQSAEDVQEIIQEIALDITLDDATRQALLEELSAILDTLNHEAISVDEALALINEAQTTLQTQASNIRADVAEQNQAIEQALEALQDENAPFSSLEEALQSLAEQFNQPLEQQSITAEQIEEAAQQLAEQAPALSEQLGQVAEQMAQQDTNSLQEQIEQALNDLQQLQQEQSQQEQSAESLEEQAEQLQPQEPENTEQEASSESGDESTDETGGEEPQTDQAGNSPSEEGEQQDAQGEGSAGGDEQSEETSTGETDDQQGENSSTSNQDGDSNTQQSSPSNNPNQEDGFVIHEDGNDTQLEAVSVPQNILNDTESEIRLETDDTISQQGDFVENPTGTISVPYNEVFNTYQNNATSALEQNYIPMGLRDVIRDYFTAITPANNR